MEGYSSKRKALKSIFKKPLRKLIYYLSGFVRRDESIWVIGAHKQSFSCNPKHFFLHVSKNPDINVRCIWISKDKNVVKKIKDLGLEAETSTSFRGVLACLKAKYYFVNCDIKDICFMLSKKAYYVNMWHGIPLKIIHDDSFKELQRKEKRRSPSTFDKIFNPEEVFNYDYILSPSKFVTEYSLLRTFGISESRYLEYGYPRNDVFFLGSSELVNYVNMYCAELLPIIECLQEGNKAFLYAPTWRDTDEDFITLSKINFESLNDWLAQTNGFFLIKLHPSTILDFNSLSHLSRVVVLDNKVDVYPLLAYVDVLITDYSSIYFDFLLTDRPIIFFPFDLESYISQCRELYFDYLDVTPGVKAYTFEELMIALQAQEPIAWKESRHRIREQFWGVKAKGGASDRLAKKISSLAAEKINP